MNSLRDYKIITNKGEFIAVDLDTGIAVKGKKVDDVKRLLVDALCGFQPAYRLDELI